MTLLADIIIIFQFLEAGTNSASEEDHAESQDSQTSGNEAEQDRAEEDLCQESQLHL